MAAAVYILGVVVTFCCGLLLSRGYTRGRKRLLLWSAICFYGLAISNLLVFLDLVIFPDVDLYLWRLLTAAGAMLVLLYGLIWEGDK
jgi:D-alanyl-lipoteichoic acid acyltransferase DltB (MBOAT superfamily)